ncbi:MAG TPA: MFS transporter [Dehalococcoidia bacterium]|nr:MFS transporter [Dehalococcoidia bacterium]
MPSSDENPPASRVASSRSHYGRLVGTFRFRDLRVLWASTLCSQFGQGMQQVILVWLMYELTGSVIKVAELYAVRSLPNLLVGLAAGSVADRLDRRALMRYSLWGMMLTTLAMVALLYTGNFTLWPLILFAFLLGTLQAFNLTARQVYAYDIVGASGAVSGIAAISLAQRAGEVLGALAAGWLIQWYGPAVSILTMSASYFSGALLIHFLRRLGGRSSTGRESLKENLLNYFRALRSNRVMLVLLVSTVAVEILGFSHQVMIPVLALDVLKVGPVGLGVLVAFRSVGGALGVFALSVLGQVQRQGVFLLVTLGLFGVGQILLGQSLTFWMALVFVTLVNVMAAITDVLHQSLLQSSVSNEQRGRAMGSWTVAVGTAPLGQLQIGYLADLSGSRIALLVNGVGLAALALTMAIFMPRLRKL